MKIGDLVAFNDDTSVPMEDRTLYIVVRVPYDATTLAGSMIEIVMPGCTDIYATHRETLEVLSESR